MEGEVVGSRPTGYTFDLTIRIFFFFVVVDNSILTVWEGLLKP